MPDLRSTPAILAPFTALRRDFSDLWRNRVAFIGGLLGPCIFVSLAATIALLGPSISDAHPGEPDDLVMEFIAGDLVRLGEPLDPTEIPEKLIVKETRAADGANLPTVTKDDKALPDPEPRERNDEPKPRVEPRDRPDRDKPDAEVSDRDRERNTPHDDPPTVQDLPGDPFGSPDGWAEMAKDGDPWATGVLAALNGMTVGSYAGEGQDSIYKFQLVVCADGSVQDVRTRQSTGKPDFDGLIRNAIERLRLPKAPPELAKQLAGKCKKIPYEFTWRGKGGKGGVQ
jgi:hypothetical protein